jgi:hypothetical protein
MGEGEDGQLKRKRARGDSGSGNASKKQTRPDARPGSSAAINAQRRAEIKTIYQSYVVLSSPGGKSDAEAAFKLLLNACGGNSCQASLSEQCNAWHVHVPCPYEACLA